MEGWKSLIVGTGFPLSVHPPALSPPNHAESHTRILPSAFGVDLVGTLCLFFYVVPTELKRGRMPFFYKHIVPTEPKIICILSESRITRITRITRNGFLVHFTLLRS